MEQSVIDKRIKELQNDSQFTFKLTRDVIDSVYRIAIDDFIDYKDKNTNRNKRKVDPINKSKSDNSKEERIIELSNEVKKLRKELEEKTEIQNKIQKDNDITENNHFQSGLVTGLKYAIMAIEGNNIEEAWKMIMKKYNSVMRPKNY